MRKPSRRPSPPTRAAARKPPLPTLPPRKRRRKARRSRPRSSKTPALRLTSRWLRPRRRPRIGRTSTCAWASAEWDTYRRRTTEQREVEKARATEKLVTSLLPVIDDFERTIDYATKNGEGGLFDGVKAVHAKLVDVLKKDGVEVIDPAGEAFDALEAQAVATVDDASVPDETVSEVYQRGYKMGTKVLRPAMVTVTSGGPKREKPQEDAEK